MLIKYATTIIKMKKNTFTGSLLIFFLLFQNLLLGQIFKLEDATKPTEFGKSIFIYEDTNNSLTLEQVSKSDFQRNFKAQDANQFQKFGYSKSAFWLRFELKNNTKETNWILDIAYSYLDDIKIYHKRSSNANWKQYFVGENYPFSSRLLQFRQFDIPLQLEQNEANEFFVKVEAGNPLIVPMFLYPQTEFYEFVMIDQLYYGIFIGVILIMMLSNLFVYWSLRERNYLFYVSQLFITLILILMMTGNLNKYVLRDISGWQNTTFLALLMMVLFATNGYAILFLNIKKYSLFAYKTLRTFAVITIVVFLSIFVLSYEVAISIIQLLIFVNMSFYVVAGILAYHKGNRSAKFYSVAYIMYLTGVSIVIGRDLGLLPFTFITTHAAEIGILCEALFLSFALSDKYRIEKEISLKDKEKAQAELLEMQLQANITLEEKVKIRTFELQEKQDEILVQNEELYQQREEILSQRDFIENKNRELGVQNEKVSQSISVARTIQQAILPYERQMKALFADYFVIYRPKDVVSGDFYWMGVVNNKIIVAAVDCTGHGVPGAFMSLIGKMMLDKLIDVYKITSPAEILERLNWEVQNLLRQKETNNQNGMDVCMCLIESENHTNDNENGTTKITFSGAKRPLYYTENDSNQVFVMKGDRKSIGGSQYEGAKFNDHIIHLKKGSCIYLTSDGFTDQNDLERVKLGESKFKYLLSSFAGKPMNYQLKQLETELDKHQRNTDQRDDILVWGITL